MKQIIFLFAFFATTISLSAQDLSQLGTPEERAAKLTEEMKVVLPLSEAEVPAVEALNLEYAKIIQADVIDADLGRYQMFKKMRKINGEKEEKLKDLLSDEQWANYESYKAEQRTRLRAQFGN